MRHVGIHARRVDQAGHDRVRADAVGRILLRDHAGHLHHRGLRRAVRQMRIAQIAHPRNRSNRDDRARSALHHARQHALAAQHQAFDVDGVDAIQIFRRGLHRAAGLADAHVVVQHIERRKPRFDQAKSALDIVLARHVCLKGDGLSAFRFDEAHGLLGRGQVTVQHAHRGAQACIGHAGRASDAPTGRDGTPTGHHYRFAAQVDQWCWSTHFNALGLRLGSHREWCVQWCPR
ncbi:hypothetical protein SDC9_138991 [bioreactor metagenome]|uniref:Uncharacterized protein n=1 Tax=bioreactor metagenome TaxID=1076179 RepID=A0A645DRA2_9ZZZZ